MIDLPKGDLTENDKGTREFMTFLKLLAQNTMVQSGTTAQRPTRYLYVGMPYYDTTLGYEINVHTITPLVWHNGAGAPV